MSLFVVGYEDSDILVAVLKVMQDQVVAGGIKRGFLSVQLYRMLLICFLFISNCISAIGRKASILVFFEVLPLLVGMGNYIELGTNVSLSEVSGHGVGGLVSQ